MTGIKLLTQEIPSPISPTTSREENRSILLLIYYFQSDRFFISLIYWCRRLNVKLNDRFIRGLFDMREGEPIKCIINRREFQVAIVAGVLAFIINRFLPQIKVWRLTPPHLPRQFFITLELASIFGVMGSCIAGPWAGLIIAIFAANPILVPEVDMVVKAAQFMAIGYSHRKLQSPWNILGIPLGILISLPIHPTLVEYILFRKVIVHLFWGTNILFQTLVSVGIYLIFRLLVSRLFEWANPGVRYRFNLQILSQINQ